MHTLRAAQAGLMRRDLSREAGRLGRDLHQVMHSSGCLRATRNCHAERRGVMALAGQPSSTGQAPATTLARHGHLRRHDLSLERRCELLRLIEPEPEFSQADRLAALTRVGIRCRAFSQPFSRPPWAGLPLWPRAFSRERLIRSPDRAPDLPKEHRPRDGHGRRGDRLGGEPVRVPAGRLARRCSHAGRGRLHGVLHGLVASPDPALRPDFVRGHGHGDWGGVPGRDLLGSRRDSRP